jgi:inorganic pyrophosphatase
MDMAAIDHRLDTAAATCRAVIETPKGSRSKYTWDDQVGAFELSGLLPVGMSFPLDFGMVPSTLADDGDPLDILVIGDEPAAVGCVADVRILGVIKAEQTEGGRTYRNDRLVGRLALSVSYEHASHIDDLGARFAEHLGQWFTNYNMLKGKGFRVLGIAGPEEAVRLIEAAARRREDAARQAEKRVQGAAEATAGV